jgi:hypothetical protein
MPPADPPSDQQAVQIAASKRKVPEDYLLKILQLSRSKDYTQAKLVDQVMAIVRHEADGRSVGENSQSKS